ncbi:MAG: M23 family metallopeptidase, partial [Myxococcota bacterium]|nr:M23 family metallopeptidase [Myxococcota bacterium]
LRDLEGVLKQSGGRLEERRDRMTLRLRAMYRLRHRGFLPLLFSAESPHQFLQVARYLWWIIKADQTSLDTWQTEVDSQRRLQRKVESERAALLQRAGEISIRREEARDLRDQRQALVGTIRGSDRRHIKTMLVEERARKLDVSLNLREEAPPGELPVDTVKPTSNFKRNKRRLPMPVVGPLTRSGRGVDIKVPEGRPIRAVAAGQVLKILHISGFGLVCIIEHGDGWSTVYGHAAGYTVKVGQMVESGEEIGLVGQTGSLEGPRLHFQIRHEQTAKNPLSWLLIPPGIRVNDH